MLESRSAYGFYGAAGGYTGESIARIHTTRMAYREYKIRWADHKTVAGSYDPQTKTIEVIFTAEEMKAKTNLGNRYQIDNFYFRFDGFESCFSPIMEFKAKTYENAKKHAQAFARKHGYTLVCDSTLSEYIKESGY